MLPTEQLKPILAKISRTKVVNLENKDTTMAPVMHTNVIVIVIVLQLDQKDWILRNLQKQHFISKIIKVVKIVKNILSEK